MRINIVPKKYFHSLKVIILLLLVLNIFGLLIRNKFGVYSLHKISFWFDFDTEHNIPTYFSVFILLLSSFLLFYVGYHQYKKKENVWGWYILAAVFLFLAYDEGFQVHESFILPMKERYDLDGIFYFAWIIPFFVALIVLFVILFNFLKKLPRTTCYHFFSSGVIFVSGAIGLEMLGGWYVSNYSNNDLIWGYIYTIEELLEMFGVSYFIYGLLIYLKDECHILSVKVF